MTPKEKSLKMFSTLFWGWGGGQGSGNHIFLQSNVDHMVALEEKSGYHQTLQLIVWKAWLSDPKTVTVYLADVKILHW